MRCQASALRQKSTLPLFRWTKPTTLEELSIGITNFRPFIIQLAEQLPEKGHRMFQVALFFLGDDYPSGEQIGELENCRVGEWGLPNPAGT